jgi:EAL domain-containing protein (putative c-di-GMP-specific phosphodiesterase class I)
MKWLSKRVLPGGCIAASCLSAAGQGLRAPHKGGLRLTAGYSSRYKDVPTVIMDRPESHAMQLASLRAAGLRMAIDDFGTGYSSLAYLKRLPVDKIKVDRSFIADLPLDAEDKAIVTAIIRMAKALGLRIVAEGVETKAQAELLRGLGCDLLQGYLTGRPMAKELLTARLKDQAGAAVRAAPFRVA